MNRDDIITKWETLEPRERDAWVAEVVFDKKIGRERRLGGEIFVIDANAPHGFQRAVSNYTSDISEAWAVVEKSAEWGGMDIGCYRMLFCVHTIHNHADVDVTAQTAPEAICLAALIAKLTASVKEATE